MTDYSELVKRLRACAVLTTSTELIREAADAIEALCAGEAGAFAVETNLYNEEEIHEDCTVVIWKNSVTGEESIGWYENNKEEYKNV